MAAALTTLFVAGETYALMTKRFPDPIPLSLKLLMTAVISMIRLPSTRPRHPLLNVPTYFSTILRRGTVIVRKNRRLLCGNTEVPPATWRGTLRAKRLPDRIVTENIWPRLSKL